MDRRLIFPAVAITAWAQQPAQPPGAAEAEAALKARVDEFYKLQVEKKFRQAEALIADDSKDDYYNRAKQQISGYTLQNMELMDDNTHARVTVKAKVTLRAALVGAQEFELPLVTNWKIENGQWVWYVDPESRGRTPFGTIKPATGASKDGGFLASSDAGIKDVMNQVTIDRTKVILNASDPEQTVIVTNHLPGPIKLELVLPSPAGIAVQLEKSDVRGGETSAVRLRLTGQANSGVVRLVASPLNKAIDIQISSN